MKPWQGVSSCPLYIVQICNWTRKLSQIMLVLILVGIILSGKLINVEYVTNSAIMRNLEQSYKQRTHTLPWGCFEWLRLNNELQVHPACHVPQSWSAAAGLGLPAAAVAGEVLIWKVANAQCVKHLSWCSFASSPSFPGFPWLAENDYQATGIDYVQLPTNYGELQQPSNLLPNYY